jgi:Fe2+ transport system protein B
VGGQRDAAADGDFFRSSPCWKILRIAPRVAFNADRLFNKSGAHGKPASTTMMDFGCNAAGVVVTQIFTAHANRSSPSLPTFCRLQRTLPTWILVASLFLRSLVPAQDWFLWERS